jgi:glycosyltransferase involved in cell wall biosynthesis
VTDPPNIRALHVFPLFGPDLPNGSERYAWMLTGALKAAGVEVDVYTTCSRSVSQKSGFTLNWPQDFPPGTVDDGIRITRFRARTSPVWMGWLSARLLDRHVHYARLKLGPVPADGSTELPLYQQRIMAAQPWWSNLLMMMSLGPVSFSMFKEILRNARKYDVILVSFFPLLTVPAIVRVAKLCRLPVVVLPLFHANDLSNNSRILGGALKRANAVLAMTRHSAEYLARIYQGTKTVEVGGGVDPRTLEDAGISGERFKTKFGLEKHKIVLFVGRKEEGKRYRVAMEAIDLVQDPTALLVMVGEDVDHLPVSGDRVRYLGRLSAEDLLDAYEACEVFVLPSRLESFGFVFIEAWARRKPVIGDSGCPAVASLIEDSVDGFVCPDAASIAERLNRLLADEGLRRSMGEAGRRKVMSKYTWPAVGARVRSIYEACVIYEARAKGANID